MMLSESGLLFGPPCRLHTGQVYLRSGVINTVVTMTCRL